MFDINDFVGLEAEDNRYQLQLKRLKNKGYNTKNIESAVVSAIENIQKGNESFVIYGDPQSGKTEMMIALTAKLLDNNEKSIIVLVNDNVKLLEQNLNRFRKSELNPTPVNYVEILEEKKIDRRLIIFCKKNKNDLEKLITKIDDLDRVVVIDDEADYASPNSKINKNLHTKINELVEHILLENGVYIGVTATPARLDLNNTFKNDTNKWIRFLPHENYIGMKTFFPLKGAVDSFSLIQLTEDSDSPKFLKDAIFSFLVNVTILNTTELVPGNYSMLIHTSGKKVDHSGDYSVVLNIFEALSNENNKYYSKYIKCIYENALEKTDEKIAKEITQFIIKNIGRHVIAILNSDNKTDIDPTDPPSLFTIAIGGNIVSRGVTFENLISMFFTRDVKHKLQQDTYIQRARMFGNRKKYLKYFELWIPSNLYNDWRRCFAYHHLALEMIENEKRAPLWIGDKRIQPVANTSIDRSTVNFDSGEMLFEKFKWNETLISFLKEVKGIDSLDKIHVLVGEGSLPKFIINFIKDTSVTKSDVYIDIRNVKLSSDYHDELYRKRGILGGTDIKAKHNLIILKNTRSECRIVYRYDGENVRSIKIFKNER